MKGLKKGFTLIELLVVVLIIGILAAVALPQYQVAVAKTHFARMQMKARAVKDAQERYYLANGAYAEEWSVLDIDIACQSKPDDKTCIDANKDYLFLSSYSSSTPYAVDIKNSTVCNNNLMLMYVYDHSPSLTGEKYCYAYDNDDCSHRLCKNMGGVLTDSSCSKSGPCSRYRIFN